MKHQCSLNRDLFMENPSVRPGWPQNGPAIREQVSGGGRTADCLKEPTLAEVMAALGKLNKRLDNIEAEKKEGDDDDDDARRQPGEGAPKELAADADPYAKLRKQGFRVRIRKDKEGSARFDSMTDHLQARADRVYSMLGMSAPKSMHGEGRDNYRRRLLHPL
jgi:hypothetical protein